MKFYWMLVCFLVLNACSSTPPSDARTQVHDQRDDALASIELARYEGFYEGVSGTFTLTPVVQGEQQAINALTLSTIPSTTAGTMMPPNPTANTVQLRQLAVRSIDAACNAMATSAGETIPAGFTGVCLPIESRSGYATSEVIRTYVEVTTLTNNHAGALSTFVKAPSDNGFYIDNTLGLWSYGRLAVAGTAGNLDRIARNWYFYLPSESGATSSFHFVVAVRGTLVSPIARPSVSVSGTDCTATTAVPTIGTRVGLSADGTSMVFVTSTLACRASGGARQVYHLNHTTNALTLVSHDSTGTTGSNGVNDNPSVSSDGRWVAWESTSTDLLPMGVDAAGYSDSNSGGTGNVRDIFVRDLLTDDIYVASVDDSTLDTGSASAQRAFISPDGTFLVFDTVNVLDAADSNVVGDIYMRDIAGAITYLITPAGASRTQDARNASVSSNGLFVAFESSDATFVAGDTNNAQDIFRVNNGNGSLTCVSLTSTGAFANNDAANAYISGDGTTVAFDSIATDMTPTTTTTGRSHVYVQDANGMVRISGLGLGSEANGNSELPSLTTEGRLVLFNSAASNLDANDSNSNWDVYMVDWQSQDPVRTRAFLIDASETNSVATGGSAQGVRPAIEANGGYGAFASTATNLTGSGTFNVFVAPLR